MRRDLSKKLNSLETRQRIILEQKRALPDSDRRQAGLQAKIKVISRQITEAKTKVQKRNAAKLRKKEIQPRARIQRRKPKS